MLSSIYQYIIVVFKKTSFYCDFFAKIVFDIFNYSLYQKNLYNNNNRRLILPKPEPIFPTCVTSTINIGTKKHKKHIRKNVYQLKGKKHHIDCPAVTDTTGHAEYWLYGKLHRLDGPAVVTNTKDEYYFINDVEVTKDLIADIVQWSCTNRVNIRRPTTKDIHALKQKWDISVPQP